MSAVIYTRISQDSKDRAGVERQEEECRKLAADRGIPVLDVLCDNSVSAWSGVARPEFDRLFTTGADVVIVWHIDRLARRSGDLERVLDAGIKILAVKGPSLDPDSSTDRMLAGMLIAVARFESDHKSERVRAAYNQRVRRGYLPAAIWGYEPDGTATPEARLAIPALFTTFTRTENIAEAQRVFRAIAPTAPCSRGAIRARLEQAAYAGMVMMNGAELVDVSPQWEPLIEPHQWRHAQSILRSHDRLRTTHERGVAQHLGTGLYVCGVCGLTMSGGSAGQYRCSSGKHLNRSTSVDTAVQLVLALRLLRYNIEQPFLPGADEAAEAEADIASTVSALEEIDGRLHVLTSELSNTDIPVEFTMTAIRDLQARKRDLDAHLSSLEPQPSTAPLWGYDVERTLAQLPLAAWRAVLAAQAVVRLRPQIGGRRTKGQPVPPRAGSFTVEWLEVPGKVRGRSAMSVPDSLRWAENVLPDGAVVGGWATPDWVAGEMFEWLNGLSESSPPLTPAVRVAVLRAIAPYQVG